MDENKIVIVSDENGVVAFDDITIKHDTVNRAEVAVLYAKKVIAIADEKRKADADAAADVETAKSETVAGSTNNTVSEGAASILADVVANDETAATEVD